MATQLIKRVVKGGYVKADTIGNGTWEIGRITKADNTHVWFESAQDGEVIRIQRSEAYKATAAEFEAAKGEQESPEPPKASTADVEDFRLEQEADGEEEGDVEEDVEGEGTGDEESSEMVKRKYKERYQKLTIGKRQTQVCGDELSIKLANMDTQDVYEWAAEIAEIPTEDLVARYEHLNHGQQRMILSNRIRAYLRKIQANAEPEE